jgi:hypothetical protein
MKRIIFPVLTALFIIACNNKSKKTAPDSLTAQADSLYQEVIDGHNEGMAGWMKIDDMKKGIQHLLDSVNTLPEKAKAGAAQLKDKLSGVMGSLQSAYNDMDKWMTDMNLDSAKDNLEQRIKYLAEEKLKASKIKEAISGSLQKADSLLKAKF